MGVGYGKDINKKNGYGTVRIGSLKDGTRSKKSAHAVSYSTFIREIPKGYECCHYCDNRACIRPSHLYIATHQKNMQDMFDKKGVWNQGMKLICERDSNGRLLRNIRFVK